MIPSSFVTVSLLLSIIGGSISRPQYTVTPVASPLTIHSFSKKDSEDPSPNAGGNLPAGSTGAVEDLSSHSLANSVDPALPGIAPGPAPVGPPKKADIGPPAVTAGRDGGAPLVAPGKDAAPSPLAGPGKDASGKLNGPAAAPVGSPPLPLVEAGPGKMDGHGSKKPDHREALGAGPPAPTPEGKGAKNTPGGKPNSSATKPALSASALTTVFFIAGIVTLIS